jgi:heme A synthase
MTGEQIAGVIRALSAAIGGYFVGKGLVDADTVAAIGGGLATVATAIWSIWAKKQADK